MYRLSYPRSVDIFKKNSIRNDWTFLLASRCRDKGHEKLRWDNISSSLMKKGETGFAGQSQKQEKELKLFLTLKLTMSLSKRYLQSIDSRLPSKALIQLTLPYILHIDAMLSLSMSKIPLIADLLRF